MDEKSGLIYAGTNSGLYVYKEGHFIKLKGPKNQIGNSFFDLKKDKKGALFCKNLNGQIFTVNGDKNSYELFYELEAKHKKMGSFGIFLVKKTN